MNPALPSRRVGRRPLAGCVLALACTLVAIAARAQDAPTVLVLYSNGRLVQGNLDVERGLRSTAVGPAGLPVRIYSEFLDRPEFGGEAYERTVTTYLHDKYAGSPPDVVVAVATESLDFLIRHRATLFPGVPLIHAAVFKSYTDSIRPLPPGVAGVPVEYDPAGTIEQALRWHPSARRLLVVTGATSRDREWEAQLRALTPRYQGRVEVEHLAGLPTPALHAHLAALGTDAVIFTPGYYQGADGQRFTPRDSVEAMAKVAGAPIYGSFATFIGVGAVAGRVPAFEAMGRQAGTIVAALLAGAEPAALGLPPVMPNALTIDWRQVRRWGIDEALIPSDAVVQFRPPSLWEAYREVALAGAAVIVLQALLIVALLFERRRRRAAELAVLQQRSELAHVSRLSVAGELTASIAHEINQPLGAILTSADAAEMILQAGGDRRDDLLRIVERIRRDDLRASEVIRRLRALLARHEPAHEAFELDDAMADVAAMLRAESRKRQVVLELRSAPPPTTVLGDVVQIQQVLINLLLNAMDAVGALPEDRRTITMAVEKGGGVLYVTVSDRGRGIAPGDEDRLFESFFSTKQRGMGLGLSIARTIVEAHGGRISAANGAGGGAVFRVELPAPGAADLPAGGSS